MLSASWIAQVIEAARALHAEETGQPKRWERLPDYPRRAYMQRADAILRASYEVTR